ncbi:hypothetical protein GGR50DRAFT_673886 [Xylaria sp. CBS 124048]|nr:hypothetical protein GGR50DRAFT_673886 [Xylaria sp. CBS 124048]
MTQCVSKYGDATVHTPTLFFFLFFSPSRCLAMPTLFPCWQSHRRYRRHIRLDYKFSIRQSIFHFTSHFLRFVGMVSTGQCKKCK